MDERSSIELLFQYIYLNNPLNAINNTGSGTNRNKNSSTCGFLYDAPVFYPTFCILISGVAWIFPLGVRYIKFFKRNVS